MQLVKVRLRNFKLSGIYNNLEERVSYAQEKSLSYSEFLGLLLEDEENNRRANSYKKRYARAKLPAHKNIEDFDFSFQPSIDKRILKRETSSLSVIPVPARPTFPSLLLLRL
jgi:DNA replication protein DnaC